jgi:hypothetical protein
MHGYGELTMIKNQQDTWEHMQETANAGPSPLVPVRSAQGASGAELQIGDGGEVNSGNVGAGAQNGLGNQPG